MLAHSDYEKHIALILRRRSFEVSLHFTPVRLVDLGTRSREIVSMLWFTNTSAVTHISAVTRVFTDGGMREPSSNLDTYIGQPEAVHFGSARSMAAFERNVFTYFPGSLASDGFIEENSSSDVDGRETDPISPIK